MEYPDHDLLDETNKVFEFQARIMNELNDPNISFPEIDSIPGLRELLKRCLELDPAKRPTLQEIVDNPLWAGIR